jgi:hypothetical protein
MVSEIGEEPELVEDGALSRARRDVDLFPWFQIVLLSSTNSYVRSSVVCLDSRLLLAHVRLVGPGLPSPADLDLLRVLLKSTQWTSS